MKDTLQIEKLEEKIVLLKKSIDSLKQSNSLSQINYELHNKQEIVNQINEFYDSAWLKLIIVISSLGFVIGIIIPILAQYFQRQNLKDLTEFIRNQMNDNFDLKIKELENFNKVEIEKKITELKENFSTLESKNNDLTYQVDGSIFFLQAHNNFNKRKYTEATRDFLKSFYFWLQTDKVKRYNPCAKNISVCIKKLKTLDELNKIENNIKEFLQYSIDELIEIFESNYNYSEYKDYIEEIKAEINRLKNVG